jgi:hypothetical protein
LSATAPQRAAMLSGGRSRAFAIIRSEQHQCVRLDAGNSFARSIAAMASANEGSSSPFSLIGITYPIDRHSLGWISMYYVVIYDSVASK